MMMMMMSMMMMMMMMMTMMMMVTCAGRDCCFRPSPETRDPPAFHEVTQSITYHVGTQTDTHLYFCLDRLDWGSCRNPGNMR